MKVEIELDYIEGLKLEIKRREEQLKNAEEQLKKLDEDHLNAKVKRASYILFNRYMMATFKALGFEVNWSNMYEEVIRLDQNLKEDWYFDTGKIHVNLVAHITNLTKTAFMHIGVIPEFKATERNKKSLLDLELEDNIP